MAPQVSVIIPHFNRSRLLRAAVESALSTSLDAEIVIVDDGSTDEELEQVSTLIDERVRLIPRENGLKGPSRCRNLGLAASRAPYVVFLDSDDLMAPWCLDERLSAINRTSDADCLVFPVMLFYERPGDTNELWNTISGPESHLTRFIRSDPPWHTSSPIWRRDALLYLGGFNESVLYGDDADLHIRALTSSITIGVEPDALPDIFVRRSAAPRITNTLTREMITSRLTRLREGKRYLDSVGASAQLLREWEGQYFVEAEFLLFNVDEPRTAIRDVILAWTADYAPVLALKSAVISYFSVASRMRNRAYLGLRVARRIAMKTLPPEFFPNLDASQHARLDEQRMTRLRDRLAA